MPDEQLAGQVAPSETQEATNTAAAQTHAATTTGQTDGSDEGAEKSLVAKTFTQDEVNDMVKREKAKAEAKAERRVLRTLEKLMPHQQQGSQGAPAARTQQAEEPKLARREGESEADFMHRVLKTERENWDKEQAQREADRQQRSEQERLAKVTDKVWKEALRTPGFDEEAFADLTDAIPQQQMRELLNAVLELEAPAKVLAHLTSHTDEAETIAGLSPRRQAAELGKLEARIEAEAKTAPDNKPPQRSNAPQALQPVKGRSGATGMPDPSDTKAYIRWANDQERAARG